MSDPIRVLCVLGCLNRGGAETMCMNLYRHIDREKIQFDFVKHVSETGDYEEEIILLGGRIYEAPRYRGFNHLAYVKWWEDHFRKHKEHQIIHGHYFTISSVYFSVAKKWGRITVAHSHNTQVACKSLKKIMLDYLVSKVDDLSDERFACSQEAGEWIFKNHDFRVLHNAIDSDKYTFDPVVREQVRSDYNIGESLAIGTVGRIEEQKNPYGVLQIFGEIKRGIPSVKLLWAGDGPLRQDIQKKINEMNLKEDVFLLGRIPDVNRVLQAMDVFILPSFYEGLSVAAIEAQASGLPCYFSDKISRETAITDRCCFLSINSPALWAETIIREDHAEEKRMNKQQNIISAGYDIEETTKWITAFYLSLSDDHDRSSGKV